MKCIEVVAAILVHEKNILCVQRGIGDFDYISQKWEFPGGKVEIGESLTEAVEREIREELMVDITNIEFFLTIKHQYPDFFITMHSFICQVPTKEIQLVEHDDHKWLKPLQLVTLDWAAADVPIAENLMKFANEPRN